jgi:hypothetical protein
VSTTLPAGVKATTGGRFDRDAPRAYFISGEPERVESTQHAHVLVAVNEVKSGKHVDTLERLCDDESRTVLLDSGIFNLTMGHARAHGLTMDEVLKLHPSELDGWNALLDRYLGLVVRFADRLWGFIELDLGGATVKRETRAMIERETGRVPMPVYHPFLDGWDYFDELAQGYDRLCSANLVKAAAPIRLRLIHTAYERARAYPYLWQHLLGVFPNENLLGLPMRGSFDSSSWVTSLRWMPSWRAWSNLKMTAHFPPDLWTSKGTDVTGQYGASMDRAEAMTAASAVFVQSTLNALREDTHPC